MKKILLILLLCVSTSVFSQNKVKVDYTAGVEILSPTGNLKTTHFSGFGENLEMAIKPDASDFSFILTSGFNYILGRDANQSITQIPALVGISLFLDSAWSVSQSAGVSFFNQAIGFKPTYQTSVRFAVGRIITDAKFVMSIKPGHENDINGFSFRLAYKLNK